MTCMKRVLNRTKQGLSRVYCHVDVRKNQLGAKWKTWRTLVKRTNSVPNDLSCAICHVTCVRRGKPEMKVAKDFTGDGHMACP